METLAPKHKEEGCNSLMDIEKASDEIRTHDIQLGKLSLYQLSYTRIRFSVTSQLWKSKSSRFSPLRFFISIQRLQSAEMMPISELQWSAKSENWDESQHSKIPRTDF